MNRDGNDTPWKFLIILLVIFVVLALIFIYLKTSTYDAISSVSNKIWVRDIRVDGFMTLPQDTYLNQMPADAYDIHQYDRSYRYVCGEVTEGSGSSEETYTVYCTGWESWATYKINRWDYIQTLETKGTPKDDRVWPQFMPSGNNPPVLGDVKEESRGENFYIDFTNKADSKVYTLVTPDYGNFRVYEVGQSWALKINRLNEAQWDTLQERDEK